MDKDNSKDFTFAKSSSLKFPVTFRMYVLELPSFTVDTASSNVPYATVVFRLISLDI